MNNTPDTRQEAGTAALGALLNLQRRLAMATTPAAFGFSATNETRFLVTYRQAAFWRGGSAKGRVDSVSGLPMVDPNVPYIQWLSAVLAYLADHYQKTVTTLGKENLPARLGRDWDDWLPEHALWLPLTLPGDANDPGQIIGGLFLVRELAWLEGEQLMLAHLGTTMVHTWQSVLARRGFWQRLWEKRPRMGELLAVAVVLALLALPMRQSVLAPAEVVARHATLVRASIDGVVDRFHVTPNQNVTKGQLLLSLDDTLLQNRLETTQKDLELAQAEHRQMLQKALQDPNSKAKVALLRGQVEQRTADLNHIKGQLERVSILADRDGVAVFSDENDWLGRPVRIGERIMMLADPQQVELEIRLPVADAVTLTPKAEIAMFAASQPDHAITAELLYASYHADLTPEGILAYRIKARLLNEGQSPPRLGLRGTAKIYGESVRLYYFLLRRPLATIRQFFGL